MNIHLIFKTQVYCCGKHDDCFLHVSLIFIMSSLLFNHQESFTFPSDLIESQFSFLFFFNVSRVPKCMDEEEKMRSVLTQVDRGECRNSGLWEGVVNDWELTYQDVISVLWRMKNVLEEDRERMQKPEDKQKGCKAPSALSMTQSL